MVERIQPSHKNVLIKSGAALVVTTVGLFGLGSTLTGCGSSSSSDKALLRVGSHEKSPYELTPQPFSNKDANEIASEHDVTTADFFLFRKETVENLTAFEQSDELFPIYPPAVLQPKLKSLMYHLADKEHTYTDPKTKETSTFKIPVNVIATIMTIESAGWKGANSGAAVGVFQVTPDNLIHYGVPENLWEKPEVNGKVAMQIFADALGEARSAMSGFDPNDPRVYARAAMAYNRGPLGSQLDFSNDNLTNQTRVYGDMFIRYALTAEIANGLRQEKQFSDEKIIRALSNNERSEIDARAYALQQWMATYTPFTISKAAQFELAAYNRYKAICGLLTYVVPGKQHGVFVADPHGYSTIEDAIEIFGWYHDHKTGIHSYAKALTPGERLGVAAAGSTWLLDQSPINDDVYAWLHRNSLPQS